MAAVPASRTMARASTFRRCCLRSFVCAIVKFVSSLVLITSTCWEESRETTSVEIGLAAAMAVGLAAITAERSEAASIASYSASADPGCGSRCQCGDG